MKRRISVLILVLMIIITGCRKNKDKDREQTNQSSEPIINLEDGVIGDKELDNGIVAKNTSLKTIDGETTIITTIINTNSKDVYVNYLDIIFKNEQREEIKRVIGYVGETISSGNNYEIETSLNMDISKVKCIDYIINY